MVGERGGVPYTLIIFALGEDQEERDSEHFLSHSHFFFLAKKEASTPQFEADDM